MATAQRTNGQPGQPQQRPSKTDEAAALLAKMVESFTPSEQTKYVYDTLTEKIETIRDLLCDQLKPHAERFVKRAMMTFNESVKLRKCSPASFVRCVLKAAECGLAIDGKLAYAVPRSIRKKDEHGEWYKIDEASFQPSYIGLIQVAKRTGKILTVYGDTVCENDVFEYERRIGADHFVHRRAQLGTPRGKVLGAYQKLILPGNLTHIEVMDIHEINTIMQTSESYKFAENGESRYGGGKKDSVWHKHPGEMQKKTVVHRALKTYQDDPGLMVALSAIEDDYDHGEPVAYSSRPQSRVGRSTINDMLTGAPTAPPAETWPASDDDPFAGPRGHQYGDDDAPPAASNPTATNALDAILDAMAACKTKQELDKKYADWQVALPEGVETPLEAESRYAELRESLPDGPAGKSKQKNFNE